MYRFPSGQMGDARKGHGVLYSRQDFKIKNWLDLTGNTLETQDTWLMAAKGTRK